MISIISAMDNSGSRHYGNNRHMGIVMGVKENIDAMTRLMKLEKFSASALKTSQTREMLSSKLL